MKKYLIKFSLKYYFSTTSSSVFDPSVCFPISLSTFGGIGVDVSVSSSALQLSE
jgi:hypothetical protein